MRVVFRVEGEPNIGLGHVMRCLALAQSLIINGHQVFFFMSVITRNFCQNRADWVGEIILLDTVDINHEASEVKQQCIELAADWLILDGYQFDSIYRQALSCGNYQFAVFDDINNSGNLYADLVINGAQNTSQLNYQVTAPQALMAIGKEYQVLRQEFLEPMDKAWSSRHSLTLMFGGSDPYNMTLLVLQSLVSIQASIPIVVITGAAYSRVDELAEFISNCDLSITYLHDCQTMARVFSQTRLALSAAGGSQFELLACATPAILLVVADNQKFASQQASTQGWCQVSKLEDFSADALVQECLTLWEKENLLIAMHQKALQHRVIDGAKALVELMACDNRSGEEA